MTADPRRLAGSDLAAALRDSRAVTLARTFDLADWTVPQRAGVNRIDWELGHLAWFAEFWILRGPHVVDRDGFVAAAKPARIAGPDAVFDSSRLAHADRWRADLPSRSELEARLAAQLEACIDAIPRDDDSDAALYFHRLALLHEDMHGEAFAWLRASLGLPAPAGLTRLPIFAADDPIRFDAARVALGRRPDEPGFAFDNEQPGHDVDVAAFEIDAAPVTQGDFLAFVEAGGYDDPAHWTGAAGRWRSASGARHPERWSRGAQGSWHARWFDRHEPLALDAPVIHVNAHEAEAWCHWRGRRLPTATEWARADRDPRFRWGGSVWEWTADDFQPYPGFTPGPYRDYSAPWFGGHRELRGGSVATHARLHDAAYRNFFTPDRRDVFAGFRSVAR